MNLVSYPQEVKNSVKKLLPHFTELNTLLDNDDPYAMDIIKEVNRNISNIITSNLKLSKVEPFDFEEHVVTDFCGNNELMSLMPEVDVTYDFIITLRNEITRLYCDISELHYLLYLQKNGKPEDLINVLEERKKRNQKNTD